MDKNCTSIDEQLGEQALQSACKAIGEQRYLQSQPNSSGLRIWISSIHVYVTSVY
ncbi:hypothetical protein BD414DRAFT_503649 [Trametes punicea]|nr:hypothetical protein BD414DRAFT_503649 [Trametes punicea]